SQGLAEAGGQNGRRPLPDGPAEKSSQTDLGPSAPPLDVVGKPAEVPVRPGGGADRGPQTDQANGDEQQLDVAQTSFESSQATAPLQQTARALEREVGKVIVGQQPVVRGVVIALLAGGHVLLEGLPGLGKTILVRTLAQAIDLRYSRIQFTPDLMPADVMGTN